MVRNYKRKSDRGLWSKVDMQKALDLCINKKMACISIAKQMYIPEPTLRRYIKKKNTAKSKYQYNEYYVPTYLHNYLNYLSVVIQFHNENN